MRSDLTARLAALPGADDLAALAARVDRADPAGVRGAGAAFHRAAEGMGGAREDVRRAVTGVGDAWRGAGAEAFADWVDEFGRAGGRTEQAVRGVGTEVDGIAAMLQTLRDEIRGHVSRALDAAAAARTVAVTRLPSGGAAVVGPEEVVRGAVAGPTADAQAAVARAEADLASAAARLRAHLGGLRGYSRLAVPDASGAVPGGSGGSAVGDAAQVTRTDGDTATAGSGSTVPEDEGTPDQGTPDQGTPDQDTPDQDTPDQDTPDQDTPDQGDTDTDTDDGAAPETASPAPAPAPTPAPAPADAPPPAPLTGGPPGKVGDWIREATGILAASGVPADKMDPDDIATIIARESGGDPDAVNNWDSNAAKGTPSQGLMQTIGPTFDAHKLPGHGDIRDPIDNIIAGVRYAIDRYGSVSSVPGIKALGHGGSYVGY